MSTTTNKYHPFKQNNSLSYLQKDHLVLFAKLFYTLWRTILFLNIVIKNRCNIFNFICNIMRPESFVRNIVFWESIVSQISKLFYNFSIFLWMGSSNYFNFIRASRCFSVSMSLFTRWDTWPVEVSLFVHWVDLFVGIPQAHKC